MEVSFYLVRYAIVKKNLNLIFVCFNILQFVVFAVAKYKEINILDS